jgi:hypothetical protein
LLCDFVQLGPRGARHQQSGRHESRTFYAAIEGWLNAISSVLNRYALPRIWKINALDPGTMPQFRPYMAQRIDLDGLGGFIANLAKAAMPLFPDEELREYIPGAAGPPEPAHYGPADPPTPRDGFEGRLARHQPRQGRYYWPMLQARFERSLKR